MFFCFLLFLSIYITGYASLKGDSNSLKGVSLMNVIIEDTPKTTHTGYYSAFVIGYGEGGEGGGREGVREEGGGRER